jgi:CheY-like chemotaxis protein
MLSCCSASNSGVTCGRIAFAMEFAQSAQEALQRIAECGTDTSLILILSDINMPGMSGLDLCPRQRRRGRAFQSS